MSATLRLSTVIAATVLVVTYPAAVALLLGAAGTAYGVALLRA